MRLVLEIDGADVWRLYEFAEDAELRVDDAAAALLHRALEKPTAPAPTPAPEEPKPPRPRVVPLIERASEYLPPDWEPPESSSRKREIGDFEFDVRRLHRNGATDSEISVELGAVRQRVARTRRRLGLSANTGKR